MILAIVQARMGSTRLPGKVLKEVNGKPLIEILLNRLSEAKRIDKIVLATSINKENDDLSKAVEKLGFDVFRGSEEDVLDRYYKSASEYSPVGVVRVTGDCPLIDANLVDRVIRKFQKTGVDYASNTMPRTYPDGLDLSVFSFETLEIAWRQAKTKYDREHVTPFMRHPKRFKISSVMNDVDYSKERWTIDELEDFKVLCNIFNHFKPDFLFSWLEVIELKSKLPKYFFANKFLTK